MPIDPHNPDTFEDLEPTDPAEPPDPQDPDRAERRLPPETPEADAAEQRAELRQQQDTPLTGRSLGEVNPADAAEQARVVDLDEDDYR